MATVQPRSVKDTLSATESSGNPNAWRRNQDGREFVGQWQFGEARLRDLGLGVNFTMDQFREDPDLQSRVMDMHIEDINKFIENNGLSAFEGRTIGGVPITRSGMIAMAHLGGSGGMQKFLETGGEYNPADELGTSLSDYALRHGGPMIASTPEATSNRLRTFAADADNRALDIRSVTEEVVGEALGRRLPAGMENMQAMAPRAGLPAIQDGMSLPMGVGQMPMAPTTQLGWGSAVPEGASPFAANGMPDPIRMPMQGAPSFGVPSVMKGVPGAPPGFSINPQQTAQNPGGYSTGAAAPGTMSTSGGIEEEAATDPERQGFLSRMGSMLFGEDETDPDGKFKTLLGGIGVGLGQMSAGMPVDLQPYFANIKAQQQAVAEMYQQQQQDAIDNELNLMNADTQRMNAETAYMKFQNEMAQAAKEGAPINVGLSPETIQKYGTMPTVAPFLEMMNSPDPEAQEMGLQGFKEAVLADTTAASTNPQAVADLYDALAAGDQTAVSEILRNNPISTEDFKRIADITDPGQLIKNAQFLAANPNVPPEVVETALKLARMQGGVGDSQIAVDNYTQGRKFQQDLVSTVASNAPLALAVEQMKRVTIDAKTAGKDIAGVQEPYLASMLAITKRALPSDWQAKLEESVGLSLDQYQEMDPLAQYIVLSAAKPMLQGQGTVTDQERRTLAASMPNAEMEYEARLAVLDRLEVLNEVDAAVANFYVANKADATHSNFEDLHSTIQMNAGTAIGELYRSKAAITAYQNVQTSEVFQAEFYNADGTRKPNGVIARQLAPNLTLQQAQMFEDMLYEGLWVDKNTGILMRGANPAE